MILQPAGQQNVREARNKTYSLADVSQFSVSGNMVASKHASVREQKIVREFIMPKRRYTVSIKSLRIQPPTKERAAGPSLMCLEMT